MFTLPMPPAGAQRALLTLGVCLASAAPLAAQTRASIDTTFRFNAEGRVALHLLSGEARISTWDRNEIRIVASTERGTLVPEFSAQAVRLEVRSVDRQMGRTRYEVTVPARALVTTRGVSASVTASGLRNDVSIQTVSGSIDLSDTQGNAELETVSGRIALREHSGNATVSSVSGGIGIESLRGALDARTVSGRVRADRAVLSSLRYKAVSGDLDFSGSLEAGGRNEIDTHSGSVALRVPSSFAATVAMQSFSGELNSDFAVTLQPGSGTGRGRRMEVAINGGGARLAITTFSGDIFLRKSDAARREN